MLSKFFSYITGNLKEEINNFPLFIPVFMGLGIGYYFSLFNEPKTWIVYSIFIASLIVLIFINFGNSSDKFKKYKLIVAFSTIKYIIKKIIKIFLFTLLLPILGHITLFIFIGGWIVSLFEYSHYLKYFAILYDNALMRDIWKGLKWIFRPVFKPIIKRVKKTSIFTFSKGMFKTSKSKNHKLKIVLNQLISKTTDFTNLIWKGIVKFFNNRFFKFIQNIEHKIKLCIITSYKYTIKIIYKYFPKQIIHNFLHFIFSLNFIIFFVILGFFIIKFQTNNLDTNILSQNLKNSNISARLINIEDFDKDYRFTFDNVKIKGKNHLILDKIRVKFSKEFGHPVIGKYYDFETSLIPPFEPSVVGGFNFARYSYYKNFSASGRSFNPWKISKSQKENDFFDRVYFSFLNFRDSINRKISTYLSYNTSGVIMSMMTGERYAISKEISENYKNSGISHLLAISGFHMTLIVGFSFFLIRFLFAFIMPIANRYNTKKLAVIFALIVSIFYLFISGARLPTQRAFLMILFALGAVVLDRNPLSIRFVSITAILILLFSPDALINAGFQMSFIAVITLIKLYEIRDKWIIKNNPANKIMKKTSIKILNFFWGNILTAFFVGLTITPFIIYNFNNVQIYSVLGNLAAIPIFSFIVMPAILFAFLFMPFNLDFIFLKIAEFGVEGINYFANIIGSLPYASIDMKSMSILSLIFIVFGFIWFFLWEGKWKRFGILLLILGGINYAISPKATVFVNSYGNIFGINTNNGFVTLNLSKYPHSKMVIGDWVKSVGDNSFKTTTKTEYTINNTNISFIDKYKDYKKACLKSDVIFTTFDKEKAFYKCKKPVFDKIFLKESMGVQFYINNKNYRYETIKDYIGIRPWSVKLRPEKNSDTFEIKELELFDPTKVLNKP